MNQNRLFLAIASAVAIVGSFLPWGTFKTGFIGSVSQSGTDGDGKLVVVLAIVALVLAVLKNVDQPLPKGFTIGILVAGALEAAIAIIAMSNINKFGNFGVSIGYGLILVLLAGLATVGLAIMVLMGGNISKESLAEAADASKKLAQTVGRVTSTTVKTAVEEIKKESAQSKEESQTDSEDKETPEVAETATAPEGDEKLVEEQEKEVAAEPQPSEEEGAETPENKE